METGGTEYVIYDNDAKRPEWGKIQWERKGCNSCHTVDGRRDKGPSWKGIWGKEERLNNGTSVMVDENYLRESMMNPGAKVVNGFEPIMPTFQGLLREHEIRGLIAYIRSLQ
jgi:cytochrome c oxidase subunit 2